MRWLPSRKLVKRLALAALALALLAFVGVYVVTSSVIVGEPLSHPPVEEVAVRGAMPGHPVGFFRVVCLNLAHGRKDGPNQLLQRRDAIRSNLDEVVALLHREMPDLVALQEADGPSVWSGGFDHVRHVAEKAGFPFFVRGEHVKGLKLSYGTAVLSRVPLKDTISITFDPSPPSFPKGFLLATATIPPGIDIDVISVHLDFLRAAVRRAQVRQIVAQVLPRRRPLVVLGDFNCDWSEENSALRELARALELTAYRPDAANLATFPLTSERLDWVLISGELEFRSYEVLSDVVSDHRAVVAEIAVTRR